MALGGINRATAYKLNAAGKLRFVKVAGRTFIPDDEVDRVAREGTEPSTQNAGGWHEPPTGNQPE
jgi:hypothetical protein